MIPWLLIAAAGAVSLVIGIAVNPSQAYYSYLTAYIYGVGIVVCALVLLMIEELIGATWFVVFRRRVEIMASALPVFVPLFLPIAVGAGWLYPWTHPADLSAHERVLVLQKTAYLNLPFFLVRSAVYLACWVWLTERMRAWSLAQDEGDGPAWADRIRALCGPGLVVLGFTVAFASIDWVMSLEPAWFSTIFGLQIFAGAMVGSLALIAVDSGRADRALVTPDHASAVGKMMFTFSIFWAYTSFSQLLIIWIANMPEEAIWYQPRISGAWLVTGLAVGVAQWAVPFALLLSYEFKRRRRALAALGWALLAAHYVEAYWIVMPQLHPRAPRPHWLDLGSAAMVIGAAVACSLWRAQGHANVAVGAPDLAASMGYTES